MALSPQYKKNHPNDFNSEDNDLSPKPFLPSFGSVQSYKEPAGEYSMPTLLTHVSIAETEAALQASHLETSNDHALAGVLTQHFASKGEQRKAQSLDANEDTTTTIARVPSMKEYLTDGVAPLSTRVPSMKEYLETREVPSITVQPASPGVEELGREFAVPQGTPDAPRNSETALAFARAGNVSHSRFHHLTQSVSYNDNLVGDGSNGIAELYTDAEEVQADSDGAEGFVSLDAILESPGAEAAAPPIATSLPTEAPLTAVQSRGTALTATDYHAGREENWDVVRAYWSGLSVQRKQQIERESQPIKGKQSAKNASDAKQSIQKQTKKKTTRPQMANSPTAAGEVFLPPWPDQQYQQSVKGKVPPMKSSMRVSHERAASEPSHMRQSMRQSMRGPDELVYPRTSSSHSTSKAPLQISASRPFTNGGPSPAAVSLDKNVVRPGSGMSMSKQPTKAPLNRTASGGSSASESSFRKKRRGSPSTADGRHNMKRSMRGSNETNSILDSRPMSPISNRATWFSLRSPSPSGSLSTARMTIRTSVHSSVDDIRTSRKPSRFSSFGKSSKPNSTMRKAPTKPVSRLVDSSDEEDERPAFRSRFNDSDDEGDRSTKLTPVRGIPRMPGQGDGDSTDLSDEEVPTHSAQINNNHRASELSSEPNGKPQGNVMKVGTSRPDSDKYANTPGVLTDKGTGKRSFFGLGKRRTSATGVDGSTPVSPIASSSPPYPEPVYGAAAAAGMAPNTSASATRHSRMEAAFHAQSAQPTPTRTSKLLRRFSQSQPGTPRKEFGKDDFPFPPPPIPESYRSGATVRPRTSDGVSVGRSASLRPTLRNHSNTSTTVPPGSIKAIRPVVTSGRTGKKKRFQILRRAFGLND